MLLYIKKILVISFLVFTSSLVQAELNIEITGGTESATPIAIVPFGGASPLSLSKVISDDLEHSGYFRPLPETDMISKPTSEASVDYRTWQALGQEYLVVGQVAGNYTVQFELFTVVKGQKMLIYQFPPVAANNLRKVAHIIADKIFERITGRKGVFDTKIAYVTTAGRNNKKTYRLQIADADGQNPMTIATSSYPLMSPTWSADGKKISYVSFETKRSAIYVQTLATGQRQKIASFPGINGAPAFSPDGSQLAVTLSKDGSPNIYVLDINSQSLRRITQGSAIDTEPVWSPDGGSIVFTSDRGGKPQLYKVSSQGGTAKRITFKGAYNARATFSKDGQKIAMVHGNGGGFKIAVLDVASGAMDVLTEGGSDESPSFAANGTMILYAARENGREILKAVSPEGKVHLRVPFVGGEVRDPAWSP